MIGKLLQAMDECSAVALATVIRVRGSVPREVGAKMIIHPQGRHIGTVGGGCAEAEVVRMALEVIGSGQPAIVSADLMGEISKESPAICGGVMDVFVERLPSAALDAAKLRQISELVAGREAVALATVVASPAADSVLVGSKAMMWSSGEDLLGLGLCSFSDQLRRDLRDVLQSRQPGLFSYSPGPLSGSEAKTEPPTVSASASHKRAAADAPHLSHHDQEKMWCFVEPVRSPPTLVVVGAGHIAQPLVEIGCLCDFSVTVLDDRAQFANRHRFPRAEHILVGPMADTLGSLAIDRDSYVVLITRGHQHDLECLLQLADKEVAYIGMIGSRRRVRGVFELLERDHNIPRSQLQRVHAPVGLDIGAKTPAEIAVTIMAEVINTMRSGNAPTLSDAWRAS